MDVFADEFVPNEEASTGHKNWVKANKGEATKWAHFRDSAIAHKKGDPPVTVPAMATKHGKALVAAGKEHMSVTDIGSVVSTPAANPLPPAWTAPIPITAGGSYTISASSSTTAPAVSIQTTAPVTLTGWVRNNGGGPCIFCTANQQTDLTVNRLFAYGSHPSDPRMAGRFIDAEQFKNITVTNCTIEGTAGIVIIFGVASSTILISKNRHHNIKDDPPYDVPGFGGAGVGNFVQLRHVNWTAQGRGPTTVEISWNEIINEYNVSFPEDIISLFYSSNAQVFDNYFQHQSKPGNAYNNSSQNTITLEGDSTIPGANVIQRNQLVDAFAIYVASGNNNQFLDNRIVADRKLPDGITNKGNGWGSPLVIAPGTSNNHAHGNYVSYIDRDGNQPLDPFDATYPTFAAQALRGAPEGGTAEAALNTFVPNPTAASEAAELTFWQNKVALNGITLGAY